MRTPLVVALLAIGCATTVESNEPLVQTKLETAPAKPPPSFDAKTWAQSQITPADCELTARRLKEVSVDQAWDALKACIERSRWPRGAFTHLDRLVAGPWDEDLQTRPDAPRMIARVIAMRGGDVEGDLMSAQKVRLPVFTLAAALKQPNTYKGRYVLMRGIPANIKADPGGKSTTLSVKETSLRASEREIETARYRVHSSGSYSGSGDYNSSRYGNESASGSGRYSSSRDVSLVSTKYENEGVETGREALGRLPQADPFIAPDKHFIFLARFDGTRPSTKDEDKMIAILTIVGYYPPSALVVE